MINLLAKRLYGKLLVFCSPNPDTEAALGNLGNISQHPLETLLGSYPEILILENQMISFFFFFFTLCEPYGSNKNIVSW